MTPNSFFGRVFALGRVPLRAAPFLLMTPVLLMSLSSCASDYGGAINGQRALSPEEQRLQAVETKFTEVSRRLNSIEAAQANAQSSDDMRNLRGQVEQLRYDVDQLLKSQAQMMNFDQRLQRLEGGAAPADPNAPGAAVAPPTYSNPGYSNPPAYNNPGNPGQAPGGAYAPPPASTVAPVARAPGVQPANASASADEEAVYLRSFDQLKAGKYDDAIGGFRGMLTRYPQGNYADNAWYWMGKSYYVKHDYPNALKSYQSLLRGFPASPKVPDALFDTGAIYQDQQQKEPARTAFQQVVKSYPSSSAATQARTRLAQLK